MTVQLRQPIDKSTHAGEKSIEIVSKTLDFNMNDWSILSSSVNELKFQEFVSLSGVCRT